jgi:hypothetical protein
MFATLQTAVFRRTVYVWLALGLGLWGVAPARAQIGLDPNAFASLGELNTSPGTYLISTRGAPTLTLPGGAMVAGVVSPGGIAVFDFTTVDIVASSTILVDSDVFGIGLVTTTRPVAILSRGSETIAGSIFVSPTSFSGPGSGQQGQYVANPPEFGPGGSLGGSGGGGFGTAGGRGADAGLPGTGGAGGAPYGDLSKQLQMGSPGGLGSLGFRFAGGGAIELGAADTLHFSGSVFAQGFSNEGVLGLGASTGGGSGGAIFMHARALDITSSALSVSGGIGERGGFSLHDYDNPGGSGGAGRILILGTVPEPGPLAHWLSTVVSVAGLTAYLRRRGRASKP